ncbi:hypothetical protein KI743_05645 [Vibrio sp. D420a]|nr:hypothetical protein [Vibrio sp. D420a]MDK9761473.1 hypothetical protein [Vibrio sp. D420a]
MSYRRYLDAQIEFASDWLECMGIDVDMKSVRSTSIEAHLGVLVGN